MIWLDPQGSMVPTLKLMAPGDQTHDLDIRSRYIFLRQSFIKPQFLGFFLLFKFFVIYFCICRTATYMNPSEN